MVVAKARAESLATHSMAGFRWAGDSKLLCWNSHGSTTPAVGVSEATFARALFVQIVVEARWIPASQEGRSVRKLPCLVPSDEWHSARRSAGKWFKAVEATTLASSHVQS